METTLLRMFCNTNPELIGQKATDFAQENRVIGAAEMVTQRGIMFYFCMEYAEMDLVDGK